MGPTASPELVFIAHQGRKRAPVSTEERKKSNSAAQKRSWQRKGLASAERRRGSYSAPPVPHAVLCRVCQNSPSSPTPATNSLIAVRHTGNGLCSNCGRPQSRDPSTVLGGVLDNNLDPFAAFAIHMAPSMQRQLRFCLTELGPKYRDLRDPDGIATNELAKRSIDNQAVLYGLLTQAQQFDNQRWPDHSTLVVHTPHGNSSARLLHFRSQCYKAITNQLIRLGPDSLVAAAVGILISAGTAMMGANFSDARTHCTGLARLFDNRRFYELCPEHLYRDAICIDALTSAITQQTTVFTVVNYPEGPPADMINIQLADPAYQDHESEDVRQVLGDDYVWAFRTCSQFGAFWELAMEDTIPYASGAAYFKCKNWHMYQWALGQLYNERKLGPITALQRASCHTFLLWPQFNLSRESPMTIMLTTRLRTAMSAMDWPVPSDPARKAVILALLFIGADATVPQSELRAFFVSHLANTVQTIAHVSWDLIRTMVQRCIYLSKLRVRNFKAIFEEAGIRVRDAQIT